MVTLFEADVNQKVTLSYFDALNFRPGRWIDQPCNYHSCPMVGMVTDNGTTYTGSIDCTNCGDFTVTRP